MGDIIARIGNNGLAMHATKGDVSSVVRQILNSADKMRSEVAPERTIVAQDFSRSTLLPRLIAEIETAVSDELEFVAECDELKLIGQ